jgi:hypothetical protein
LNPSEFLDYLTGIVPSFKSSWECDKNYSLGEDGSFTFHGICSEFSQHFIDQEKHKYVTRHSVEWKSTISEGDMVVLLKYFEESIEEIEMPSSLKTNSGLLSNAVCTCFLEDIAQTNAGEYAKSFMGSKSRAYFDQWHVYEKRL